MASFLSSPVNTGTSLHRQIVFPLRWNESSLLADHDAFCYGKLLSIHGFRFIHAIKFATYVICFLFWRNTNDPWRSSSMGSAGDSRWPSRTPLEDDTWQRGRRNALPQSLLPLQWRCFFDPAHDDRTACLSRRPQAAHDRGVADIQRRLIAEEPHQPLHRHLLNARPPLLGQPRSMGRRHDQRMVAQ